MKRYYVNVDITMSKGIVVEAESEAEAMEKVDNLIGENPYNYTSDFSHYVNHEVIDAEIE
jgi:hypothetical protein